MTDSNILMVDTGISEIIDWLGGTTATSAGAVAPAWFNMGFGTTTPSLSNTALLEESTASRQSASPTRSKDELKFDGTIGALDMNDTRITEYGLFTASTTGVMFVRGNMNDYVKTDDSSLEIEIYCAVEIV